MTSITLNGLKQHIASPCSNDAIKLKKWQIICSIVVGVASSLLLIAPGFIAFYGLSFYFKQKAVKELKRQQDTLDGQFQSAILNKDKALLRELLLSKNLDSLLKDRSDNEIIEISVEGKRYTLSKTLLVLFIPFFKMMFNAEFGEAKTHKVKLPELSQIEWENVLECLFFNKALPIDETNILRYIYIADLLQIPKVKKLCRHWIGENLKQIEPSVLQSLFEDEALIPYEAINRWVEKRLNFPWQFSSSGDCGIRYEGFSKKDSAFLTILSPFVNSLKLQYISSYTIGLVSNMQQLKKLSVKITDNSQLALLRNMPQLDYFEIKCAVRDISSFLRKLFKLPNVTSVSSSLSNVSSIDFSNTCFCDKDMAQLSSLHKGSNGSFNIDSLNLGNCPISNKSLKSIAASFQNLKHLYLKNCDVSEKGLLHITSLSELESLDLSLTYIEEITPLTSLINLKTLNLQDCWSLSPKSMSRVLPHLKKLQNLSILNLYGKTLNYLTGLHNLRSLRIDCSLSPEFSKDAFTRFVFSIGVFWKIRDKDINEISQFKKLKKLHINGTNKLTNNGITKLASLPKLRELTLEKCSKVTHKGIVRFHTQAPMMSINIVDCKRIKPVQKNK